MEYYQHDLALVHARGFGQHADRCAPGVLDLLAPVRGGLVLEVGCGAGALTRHLLAAGHRVIATDASAAMVELARAALGPEVDVRRLALPDDPLPAADAIVSVGHVISYLPDAAAVDRALVAMAGALRPGGVLAIDICDLEFGRVRAGEANRGLAGPDWAVITEFSTPAPEVFVRDVTTFVPDGARRVAARQRAPRERAGRHVPDPGAAGVARRDGHGGDVVRRCGAAAGDARRDRGQNLTRGRV